MRYLLQGGATVLVLAALLAFATHAGTRLGARLFSVRQFRWFDARPAEAALWRRLGARSVGSLAPLVLCMVLVFFAHLFTGDSVPTTSIVVFGGPARQAGLQDGDRVLAVDGLEVRTWDELRNAIRSRGGERRLEIERAGLKSTLSVVPNAEGVIGIQPVTRREPVSVGDALVRGLREPVRIASAYVHVGLKPGGKVDVAGPVAIVRATGDASRESLFWYPSLLASAYWPIIAGIHVFDALTLALFRWSRRSAVPASDATLRIARRRQTLLIALGCTLLSLFVQSLGKFATAGPATMPPIFLAQPGHFALYPLVWLLAFELTSRRRAWALFALCLLPVVGLFVGGWLVAKAGRALKAAENNN